MNEQLQQFARASLVEGLAKLPEDWQRRFRLMYARDGGRRSVAEAEAMPIQDVVAQMPAEKLDWAMQQVDNSLKKLAAKETQS